MDGISYRTLRETFFNSGGSSADWYVKNMPFLPDAREAAEVIFKRRPGLLTEGFVTQAIRGTPPASSENIEEALADKDKLGSIVYALQHTGPISRISGPMVRLVESSPILSRISFYQQSVEEIKNRNNSRPVGIVRSLAINPVIAGQGIRAALLKQAAAHLLEAGASDMVSFAPKGDEPLHEFFKAQGGRTSWKEVATHRLGDGYVYQWDRQGLEELANH